MYLILWIRFGSWKVRRESGLTLNSPAIFSAHKDLGVKENMMNPSTSFCFTLSEAWWMIPSSIIFYDSIKITKSHFFVPRIAECVLEYMPSKPFLPSVFVEGDRLWKYYALKKISFRFDLGPTHENVSGQVTWSISSVDPQLRISFCRKKKHKWTDRVASL